MFISLFQRPFNMQDNDFFGNDMKQDLHFGQSSRTVRKEKRAHARKSQSCKTVTQKVGNMVTTYTQCSWWWTKNGLNDNIQSFFQWKYWKDLKTSSPPCNSYYSTKTLKIYRFIYIYSYTVLPFVCLCSQIWESSHFTGLVEIPWSKEIMKHLKCAILDMSLVN